jgi:hypothetical protein
MIKVTSVRYVGGYRLALTFEDGTDGIADLEPEITARKSLRALLDKETFAQAHVDLGTVCWPGQLDLAAERLYAHAHGKPVPDTLEQVEAQQWDVRHEHAVEKVQKTALAAAKALPVVGTVLKFALETRDVLLTTGTQNLQAAVQAEVAEHLVELRPLLLQNIAALEAAGVPFKAADAANFVGSFSRAWAKAANQELRERLDAAFLRSFNKDLFEQGLINALWERLERLAYGDLRLLNQLCDLVDYEAFAREHSPGGAGDIDAFHGANLIREGLAWASRDYPQSTRIIYPTDLGRRMRELAWAQLPEPGEALKDEEK